jgi:signal transduction histidine kinase
MDGKDGFSVLSALRSDPRSATIPIILMTGWGSKGGQRQAMSLGADDYLRKPFNANELLSTVRARLERQSTQEDSKAAKLRELRRSLIYVLPEELRSPLTTILGFGNLLQEEATQLPPDDVSDIAANIVVAGKQIRHMSDSISIFSEITYCLASEEKPKIRQTTQRDDLAETVEDVKRVVSPTAEVAIELPDCVIAAERSHLTKALYELVLNGFHYTSGPPRIKVSGIIRGPSVILCVRNHGSSFTPEEIAKVGPFMKFKRSERVPGLGLGLAIAQLTCKLYGGAFSIGCSPPATTRIFLSLPIAG